MNRHVFADYIIIADLEVAPFALEFHILRFASKTRPFKDAITQAKCGVAFDHGKRSDGAAGSDDHIWLDDRVWADGDVRCDLSARTDDGGRVDQHTQTVEKYRRPVNKNCISWPTA